MNTETLAQLRALVHSQPVAALATLHGGEPAVSLVPYAARPDGSELLIHVSRLASHTRDLEAHARVALLVHGEIPADTSDAAPTPLAQPRLSLTGTAHLVPKDSDAHTAARAAYLRRFPEAEELFSFGDFSLWRIAPEQARFVAGFGRAHAVSEAEWRAAFRTDGD